MSAIVVPEHGARCHCGHCSAARGECEGFGHDWLDGVSELWCFNCGARATWQHTPENAPIVALDSHDDDD